MPEQNLIRNTVCNWAFLELSARVPLLTCPTPLMLTLCGTDRSSAATSCRRRRATRRATSSTPTSWWTYARLAARRSSANQNTSTTTVTVTLWLALRSNTSSLSLRVSSRSLDCFFVQLLGALTPPVFPCFTETISVLQKNCRRTCTGSTC